MKYFFRSFVFIGVLFQFLGCEHKITPPKDTGQPTKVGDTSYVEISPPWGPFGSPRAIMIGNDQLIYVADYDSNRIIMMDVGGTILKSRRILHPISIAQNSKLDLYVGGEMIPKNRTDTIGAIFRISLVRWDSIYQVVKGIDTLTGQPIYGLDTTHHYYNHDLENAHIDTVYKEPGRPQRRFTGIGILPDNSYLVTRIGPDNNSPIDPDCSVLQFNKQDGFITPIGVLYPYSQGGTIDQLTNIMIFPKTMDFIITQKSPSGGVAYGVIWMIYKKNADYEGWSPYFDPIIDGQRGIDFVRSYLFKGASGIAYDSKRREIFIADAELDSIIKFNRNGILKTESFGKYKLLKNGFAELDHPSGLAYSKDCTLYIADTRHKLIRRFKLSTQLQCN